MAYMFKKRALFFPLIDPVCAVAMGRYLRWMAGVTVPGVRQIALLWSSMTRDGSGRSVLGPHRLGLVTHLLVPPKHPDPKATSKGEEFADPVRVQSSLLDYASYVSPQAEALPEAIERQS